MASSHGNTHTESAKMEQIITEFFIKSLHIILESRSPYVSSRNFSGEQMLSSPSSSSSSSSSMRPRDKWFNLALRECPENLDVYRPSNLEPMVVDVILVQRQHDWDTVKYSPKRELIRNLSYKESHSFGWKSDQDLKCDARSEKIIERWIVQYESGRSRDSSSGNRRSSNTLQMLYKKSILLLRSLYVTARLLPAYKIFRDLNSSGQLRSFTLTHRVSSFVEPFTRKEEAAMQRFVFSTLDTSSGRICLSVVYCSSLSDVISEPSAPMSPQLIPDYVGSPLADPLKTFPSLPVAHGSPSSLPFLRRHSWSVDRYKNSPPSISFSPSPTHSEPHALISNSPSHRFPPLNFRPHTMETSSIHKKNISYDEYCPSPNFSPSPSPSSPIYIPRSSLSRVATRSESAPVNIPISKLDISPSLANKRNLPPSPPLKGTRVGSVKSDKGTGLFHAGASVEKFPLGKDDSRKYSGVRLSTNSSPQISFSRCCSRSYQDDLDDPEFPCPFDVEGDDDMTDPGSRPESYDQNGHLFDPLEPGGIFLTKKSQDAAVGALVRMLRKAGPLHQDYSFSANLLQDSRPKVWSSPQERDQISEAPSSSQLQQDFSSSILSSGLVAPKTTADALEELKGYKEMMKDLLLRQASRSDASTNSLLVPKTIGSTATGF